MVKISIVDEYRNNVNTAASSVDTLSGTKLTATDISRNKLGPFTDLINLEKKISSTVDNYVDMSTSDIDEYMKVSDSFKKADQVIADSYIGGKK